jgi:spermidine/putrescine transport system ATP-binding protein
LARALINHPRVLLLDEPLGALDLKLRKEMQIELKRIQNEVGITFIHVTHDQEEAMTMADTIAVMNQGRIERMGTATEIYEDPRFGFVAAFLGASNLMHADVADASSGTVVLEHGTRARVLPDRIPAGSKKVRLGVRPEKIRLVPVETPTEDNAIVGRVVDASFIGVSTHYIVETDEITELAVMVQNLDDLRFAPGEKIKAVWPADRTFVVT